MYSAEKPKKFIWMCDQVEVVGKVRFPANGGFLGDGNKLGDSDSFDIELDPEYQHLASYYPANCPFTDYKRPDTPPLPMLHCETYTLNDSDINRNDPWWGPAGKGDDRIHFLVKNPATGESRELLAGDHVRVVGRWVIDHHPEWDFDQGSGANNGLKGKEFIPPPSPVPVRVGFSHAELHPFDWKNIELVVSPAPTTANKIKVTIAAPMYREVFVGDGHWLGNETSHVDGHLAVEDDRSNVFQMVHAQLSVPAPPLPPGFTGVNTIIGYSWEDIIRDTSARTDVTTESNGITANVSVEAPMDVSADRVPIIPLVGAKLNVPSFTHPAKGQAVFQSTLSVFWLPRLQSNTPAGGLLHISATQIGVTSSFEIFFRNIALDTLNVTGAEVSGVDARVFTVDQVAGPVASGQLVKVSGKFTPNEARTFNAQILLYSNDPAHPQTPVNIAGSATNAPPSGDVDVSSNPGAIPTNTLTTVTVSVADRQTRVPVAGQVFVANPGEAEQNIGPTNAPIQFKFIAQRVLVSPVPPRTFKWELPAVTIRGMAAPYSDAVAGLNFIHEDI